MKVLKIILPILANDFKNGKSKIFGSAGEDSRHRSEKYRINRRGGGRVVSASESETSVPSSTPASAIIYDACTSIKKKKKKKKKKYNVSITALFKSLNS